jgi:sulfur-oxidizing protein SoxY
MMSSPALKLSTSCARVLAALLLALSCVWALDCAAADAREDRWPFLRANLFKDRAITEDTGGEIISLIAPARAQDAAVVPISISTRVEQTRDRYVSKVYLLIDQNPSPVAAIFSFTPDSGRADIETRVRVEDYTWMHAVAEMNDGKLYMSARYVKAAGGCSAPYGTAPDFDAFKPRLKLKVDASVVPGQPSLAQLMIQHPNSSGMAKDQMTQLFIPPYYVRSIQVSYAGHPILQAQVDFSISENPNFRFYFMPREAGELKAVVVDTKERIIESTVQVEIGQN